MAPAFISMAHATPTCRRSGCAHTPTSCRPVRAQNCQVEEWIGVVRGRPEPPGERRDHRICSTNVACELCWFWATDQSRKPSSNPGGAPGTPSCTATRSATVSSSSRWRT